MSWAAFWPRRLSIVGSIVVNNNMPVILNKYSKTKLMMIFTLRFAYTITREAQSFQKPEPKVPHNAVGAVNLDKIASSASIRGIGHLVHCFGKNIRTPIKVVPDVDIDEKMDLSFVSIGGRTNYKSCDLIDDPSNVFVDFGPETIVSKSTKFPFVKAECVIDYGFIIKIHPEGNSKRTWICCSGFGEWGTSGAAWYLATHWNEIRAYANDKPFAYITKTRVGSDDSTTWLYRFLSEKEVIETSKKLNTNLSILDDRAGSNTF